VILGEAAVPQSILSFLLFALLEMCKGFDKFASYSQAMSLSSSRGYLMIGDFLVVCHDIQVGARVIT
jgi:hypothetical protein